METNLPTPMTARSMLIYQRVNIQDDIQNHPGPGSVPAVPAWPAWAAKAQVFQDISNVDAPKPPVPGCFHTICLGKL